jgi:hypothetical protein
LLDDIVLTTDNAPAVAKAMDVAKVTRVPCCGHVISLAVKRVNKNVAPVRKWKKIVTDVAGNFRHSNAHMELLLQEQRNEGVQNPKKPVQEGDTRWNSTHYMLERFVLLYRFIVAVKDKYDIRELKAKLPDNPHMSEELVDVSKIYSEFLKPFKVLSEGCQAVCQRCHW